MLFIVLEVLGLNLKNNSVKYPLLLLSSRWNWTLYCYIFILEISRAFLSSSNWRANHSRPYRLSRIAYPLRLSSLCVRTEPHSGTELCVRGLNLFLLAITACRSLLVSFCFIVLCYRVWITEVLTKILREFLKNRAYLNFLCRRRMILSVHFV